MLSGEKRKACKDNEAGHVSLLSPTPWSLVYVLLHTFRVCVRACISLSLSADGIILSYCLRTGLFFYLLYHRHPCMFNYKSLSS